MSIIRVHGRNLHYATAGQGPDLILLPGASSNMRLWHMYVAPLLRREFRVTTCDLRGYDAAPGDLLGVLDQLDIPRAILAGHDVGASVCLSDAQAGPARVSRLILLDPDLASLAHDVRNVSTPALLACARESRFADSYDYLQARLPNCTPVWLPRGRRFGSLECPELLTEHILNFLRADTFFSAPAPASRRLSA